MTLIDFGVWSRQHNTVCEHYANLVERSTGEQFKVCGGNNRMQNVYTSKTSTLEIEIASTPVGIDRKYFLLKYACKRNSAVKIIDYHISIASYPIIMSDQTLLRGNEICFKCNYYYRCRMFRVHCLGCTCYYRR